MRSVLPIAALNGSVSACEHASARQTHLRCADSLPTGDTLAADDDSGMDKNAMFHVALEAGKTYILRVRLYYNAKEGDIGILYF